MVHTKEPKYQYIKLFPDIAELLFLKNQHFYLMKNLSI